MFVFDSDFFNYVNSSYTYSIFFYIYHVFLYFWNPYIFICIITYVYLNNLTVSFHFRNFKFIWYFIDWSLCLFLSSIFFHIKSPISDNFIFDFHIQIYKNIADTILYVHEKLVEISCLQIMKLHTNLPLITFFLQPYKGFLNYTVTYPNNMWWDYREPIMMYPRLMSLTCL